MIEVFKTSVSKKKEAISVAFEIKTCFPGYIVNFDLYDVDHVLRIENKTGSVLSVSVIKIMKSLSHQCEILE